MSSEPWRIEHAFQISKVYTADQVIAKLYKHRRGSFTWAIFQDERGFYCVRKKYGPALYHYAQENGADESRFLGFYGQSEGYRYFAEDQGLSTDLAA